MCSKICEHPLTRRTCFLALLTLLHMVAIPVGAQPDPVHQQILDKLNDLEQRMTVLENKVNDINTRVTTIDASVTDTNGKVTAIGQDPSNPEKTIALKTILDELTTTEQPVVKWTHRWCMKVPLSLSLNIRDKAEAAASLLGSLGARVFGTGAEGRARVNGKFEVFVSMQPGIGLEYTYCGPQTEGLLAAQSGQNTLADRIMQASNTLGVTSASGSNALDLLSDLGPEMFEPTSLLADGETALTKVLKVLPLNDKLRNNLPTGSALASHTIQRMENLCSDSGLAPSFKTKINEFCQLGKKAPSEVWAASVQLIQTINSEVQNLKSVVREIGTDVDEIYGWVEYIYKHLP